MMLFFACFAFLMCIHTEVECYMTLIKGNTTVLETQHCIFWTLFVETSLYLDNA